MYGTRSCRCRPVRRLSATVPLLSKTQSRMADDTSVALPASVTDEDLRRAEEFTLEPFIHDGEDPSLALAEGTARRRALDDALAEIDAGRDEPSVEWRREYSLMLGLERLLADDEPHLADGTTLNAHQVDALSGTLIALLAEIQNGKGNGTNGNGKVAVEELPSGEEELEGDEEIPEDEEPVDWDPAAEVEVEVE